MEMGKYKPVDYTKQFTQRTRMLREAAGFESYKDMAKALDLPDQTYYHYETRTCLPHHLVPKFIELTGATYPILFGVAQKTAKSQGNSDRSAA